jgi:outer membrane protein assembly factor BamB
VCSGVITNRVFAVDATSGAFLWQLPDSAANRVAPTVTAVWHGAVYGYTDNGPLVLDARTGADRDDSPGAAPNVVDGFVGIAPPQVINGPMIAYPAAG